jgi:hypothetical protein
MTRRTKEHSQMNELAELSRLRDGTPAADLDKARTSLHAQIATASIALQSGHGAAGRPRRARQHRPGLWRAILITGTAVAALAGFILAGHLGAGPSRPAANEPVHHGAVPHGVARTAAQLVDYATKAAAAGPAFHPRPHQWIYMRELVATSTAGQTGYLHGPPNRRTTTQTWMRVDGRAQAFLQHGKLIINKLPPGSPMVEPAGWPSGHYSYYLSLPTSPAKLKAVILANIKAQHYVLGPGNVGVFNAVQALLRNVVLPPRLRAGLYGVLAGLADVRFDRHVRDLAGQRGVGLYTIQDRYLKDEIVINPRTYAYMGTLDVAVRAHTSTGLDGTLHVHKGQVLGWSALVRSGIVNRAGQYPGS